MSDIPPHDHIYWDRSSYSEEYFDRADELREKFYPLAVLVVGLFCLAPFLAIWVVSRAHRPHPIQVLADGRVFSGEISLGGAIPDEVIFNQMRETVRVLMMRTEKGGVPGLDDFVGEGVVSHVASLYAPSMSMEGGYTQNFSITESKVLKASPSWAALGVRGMLTSRTAQGYQVSEVFFVAGFKPGKKADRNPTGWRLIRFVKDDGGATFYDEELSRIRAERLGVE